MSCFDVNDARSELLIEQGTNKSTEMSRKRTRSAADERPALSKVRFMMPSLRAGMPGKEDRYVQRGE